ncbi:traf6, partial [Symbiodinium natans]
MADGVVCIEEVEECGHDEDWVDEPVDLQCFECPICSMVARNAVSHDCGNSLFCSGCWNKCLASRDSCPTCNQQASISSAAPAHVDRRRIINLKIRCPNRCSEEFPLCEKEAHLQECPQRLVPCSECDEVVRANELAEHKEGCRGRLSPCKLCGEMVFESEMAAHFGGGEHYQQVGELLDLVSSLQKELHDAKIELNSLRDQGRDRPKRWRK